MPKIAEELGPLDVKRLTHAGGKGNALVAVGGVAGLYLQLTPKNGKTWILRMRIGDRRRDIGLGGFPTVTLALAREKARTARAKVEAGIDPVEERKAARATLVAERKRGMLFSDAVDKALGAKLDAFKNEKHRKQWRATLDAYALPELGQMAVQDIGVQDVLRVLQPIWQTKTETASRLRGRIEAVLSWATVSGHRSGDNPARWGGNLKELLPAASAVAVTGNHPALALGDAAAWFADLRTREGFGARAVEFAALTAARSGEVRGAVWDEIDLEAAIWTIPAARMKMKREHRVPLTPVAAALLEALPRLDGTALVFPAAKGGQLSDMTLSATMRRIHEAAKEGAGGGDDTGYLDPRNKRPAVPHGLRSTFRDWAAEKTQYPGDMAEVALAHRISSAVEAAYRRGDMVEKRRRMMADWADFLTGRAVGGNVVRIGA
ncbi:MAG: integrase arm-type DNA-binding domain-containing protein [Pseudotabrizicola sp.]|uniref:tyrosine-type recombinase/integrase n=1 Tax=Pseudotabrizicola sp. TaxID=2939647 RepID=UPI00271919C5|nr:site-specific integrase [Pseudotabrizicola sp.]MDO9637604.1 integrase arm-type DNA-binding domain-containing protein [Pseudotabrizicola sp.]